MSDEILFVAADDDWTCNILKPKEFKIICTLRSKYQKLT